MLTLQSKSNMKQLIILLSVLSLVSCSSNPSFKKSIPKIDTVVCIYVKDYSGNVFGGVAQQVKQDISKDVAIDETTSKKQWVRDTSYIFLVFDTLFTKDHKDSLDKSGKVAMSPRFGLPIPKQYVSVTTIKLP